MPCVRSRYQATRADRGSGGKENNNGENYKNDDGFSHFYFDLCEYDRIEFSECRVELRQRNRLEC